MSDLNAQRFLVLGYITAVTIPPAGLILGVIVARRADAAYAKHGRWIIALSAISAIVWILIFASGVINTTNDDFS